MLWFFFTTEPCPTAIGGSRPGHVFRPKPGKFTPCGRFRSAIHIECLDKWRETDHHWIFDMTMLQNYCFRPNLDGSISTISSVAIPLILHVGSPHSYNQWQCYIPEIVDCMLYQVVGPPIYAQISPVSHTFVTSECILYIYIYRFIFGRVIFWLHIHAHGQDVIFVSFSFGQASRCRRHNGGLSGWCRMASAE